MQYPLCMYTYIPRRGSFCIPPLPSRELIPPPPLSPPQGTHLTLALHVQIPSLRWPYGSDSLLEDHLFSRSKFSRRDASWGFNSLFKTYAAPPGPDLPRGTLTFEVLIPSSEVPLISKFLSLPEIRLPSKADSLFEVPFFLKSWFPPREGRWPNPSHCLYPKYLRTLPRTYTPWKDTWDLLSWRFDARTVALQDVLG